MDSHAILRSLVLLAVAAVFVPPATAEVRRGEHGRYYLPEGLDDDTVVPVLFVERGMADDVGKLWPALSARMPLIVVESLPPRAQKIARRLVTDPIVELAEIHPPVLRSPWFVAGFGEGGQAVLDLVLDDPSRYQGVVLINADIDVRHLPPDLEDANGVAVSIVHGTKDPKVDVSKSYALRDRLVGAGFKVFVKFPDTRDHLAPARDLAVVDIAAFLQRVGSGPVPERALGHAEAPVRFQTIEVEGGEGLPLTGDLYATGAKSDPIVVLFHKARSSRGEYRAIAPRLVEAGFNALAIDARSGEAFGNVPNETARRAAEAGVKTDYAAARADLERAIRWARELGYRGPLAIVGSSYSASLAVFVAAENEEVDAVVAFSPGDYLEPRGSILEAAAGLTTPMLIVAPPNEEAQARRIHEKVASDRKRFWIHIGGVHGAQTLVRPEDTEEAWNEVVDFLRAHLRAP